MLSNLCSQWRICCLSLELNFRFDVALADSEIPCWLPEEDCAHWLREKFAPSLLALLRRCFLWISACLSWWHSYSCYFVAGLFSAKLTVWDAVSLRNFCLCYLEQHSGGWSWEIHLRLSLPILRLRTLLCIWELERVFAYSINYCQILQKFYCPFLTKFFSWKQSCILSDWLPCVWSEPDTAQALSLWKRNAVSGSKATLSLCAGVMSQTSWGSVLAGDVGLVSVSGHISLNGKCHVLPS